MSDRSSVTLRALEGAPLEDERIRDMVIATAHAIGERQGVEIVEVGTDPTSITVTLVAPRIAAIGFAAELRRLTTRWYTSKFDAPTLWGAPPDAHDYPDNDDDNDRWWRGQP